MGQNKGAACGQSAGRNLYDLYAVDLTDDALDEHLLRLITVLHKCRILLEKIGEAVAAKCNTTLVGDVAVAESLVCIEEHLIGITLGASDRAVVAESNSGACESLKHISVKLGDSDLVQLARKSLARVRDHLRLDLVALVNDKGEAAILANLEGLHVTREVSGGTVTGETATLIVVHGYDRNAEHLYGINAGELIVVVKSQHCLRLTGKSLVNIRRVLGSEVNSTCHV